MVYPVGHKRRWDENSLPSGVKRNTIMHTSNYHQSGVDELVTLVMWMNWLLIWASVINLTGGVIWILKKFYYFSGF